jgi:hypothetical protein
MEISSISYIYALRKKKCRTQNLGKMILKGSDDGVITLELPGFGQEHGQNPKTQ